MEAIMTELQRVQSASSEAKAWLIQRIAYVKEHIKDFETAGSFETDTPHQCIFCGKEITHCYNEIHDNNIGWRVNLEINPGKHIEVLYCNTEECSGRDRTLESEEAKQKLMWRENTDGSCSYNEVIGETGPEGTTPATTKYFDEDEDVISGLDNKIYGREHIYEL